jgi:septum formation inhibitor-activating ATPase MinD
MLGLPLLGAIPEDTDVIVSTNRGEPLVLRKKLTLSGIAFENTARRLVRAHPSRPPPPHTHSPAMRPTE